ncbi:MAG: DUF177 domain-containing protein [Aquificae bacterium]|jgi:uncharacterized protein|nr:DUF177 domain-containing protein [Aquificota bacterium]
MQIKIDLKQIFEKEKQPEFKGTYEIDPKDLGIPADVGEVKKPIKVNVHITKNPKGEGYKITYNIEGNVELTCSRCLETFDKDLSGEHTLKLQNGLNDDRENLREGDLSTYSLEGDVLNLTELIREQIILDVPYKPLCHPECKGIEYETPSEEAPNSGSTEKENSPFAGLKKLLDKKG